MFSRHTSHNVHITSASSHLENEVFLQDLRGFMTHVIVSSLSYVYTGLYGFTPYMIYVFHKRLRRYWASKFSLIQCRHVHSVVAVYSSRRAVLEEDLQCSLHVFATIISSYVMYFSCYVYTLDTHVTHACPEFKSKSIEEVYNTSKSKFSSRVCNKRQHTLLHQTLDRPAGVTAVASDLSNSYVILSRYKSIFSSAILMSMLFYHGYF